MSQFKLMSSIKIKNEMEIAKMKKTSDILSMLLGEIALKIRPGVPKIELDTFAENYIKECKAKPAFKGYLGYKHTLCISENNKVVHGIPDSEVIKDGDIVSVDCGIEFEGYYSDSAFTFSVGNVSEVAIKLVNETYKSLNVGMKELKNNGRLGDYGYSVQKHVEEKGYSVVRSMVGHGIGKKLHENPEVTNYGSRGQGIKLRKGMTFAVEPMINFGRPEIYIDKKDGWTVKTKDGSLSAHFEHVVVVDEAEPIVLTNYDFIFNAINKNEWLNKHLLNKMV